MRKKAMLIIISSICMLLIIQAISAVSIYDIQYTTVAGNGSYPSLLAGTVVSTTGIVTAVNYSNGSGYYLSMPEGGAYQAIYIYDDSHTPNVGDALALTGQVWEYYGWTELRSITSYNVISTGNPLPGFCSVSTALAASEAYESVMCEVLDVNVTQGFNQYSEWLVNDGSGACMIAGGFFDQQTIANLVSVGNNFEFIRGVVSYSFSSFRINPRTPDDVAIDSQVIVISLPTLTGTVGSQLTIPMTVSNLTTGQGYTSYHCQFTYNPQVISYTGYSTANTISAGGAVTMTNNPGNLGINYTSATPLNGAGTLLNLTFSAVANGVTPITATGFVFGATPVQVVNPGLITIGSGGTDAIGDTLTVIQRPILNVPAIVIPGENLTIECIAPPSTNDWTASLKHENKSFNLPITNTQYVSNPSRWLLTATVPNVNVFELYDLQVNADGGISDITRNAVSVLPSRKTNYYFAHVTDTHMPSHIFYPDAGYDTDSTEVVDFREVVKDLNLIRPEFLLLTGDLVNQGELEDFENLRCYTKAQRLLTELEIPVYLVTGNHDIGGWDSTSPPDGSSRRYWWKFFGWQWLDNSSSNWQYHTQDYSFDYGDIHYVGMEAYINYDDFWPVIYGSESFTAQQMQWLSADLAASDAPTKVMFYHYDFGTQLNLSSLDVDLALWGHIHSNQGSIATAPYDLATDGCCDGGRAYRIVRVNGTSLTPYSTSYAGYSGSQISISYFPNNFGVADSVSATVVNNQPLSFENALVKFVMPHGGGSYAVTNGTLEQVDSSGVNNICYVRINLTANSTVTTTIRQTGTGTDDETSVSSPQGFNTVFPNPFRNTASIGIKTAGGNVQLTVYNLKGEIVQALKNGYLPSGNHTYTWDGKDFSGKTCPSGLYLIRLSSASGTQNHKIVLVR